MHCSKGCALSKAWRMRPTLSKMRFTPRWTSTTFSACGWRNREPRGRLLGRDDLIVAGFDHFDRVPHLVGDLWIVAGNRHAVAAESVSHPVVNPWDLLVDCQISRRALRPEVRAYFPCR